MGAAEETQLIYIKGLLTEFGPAKIKEAGSLFNTHLEAIKKDEELESIGMVVLARWGIE